MLLLLLAVPALAQEENNTEASFIDLFFGSFASTEERIVNRHIVGDYEVTIEGQRFVDDAYLELYLTEDGNPIATDTPVHIISEWVSSSSVVSGDDTNTIDSQFEAEAIYQDGAFVLNPAPFSEAGTWEITVSIGNEAHQSSFRTRIYDHKPDNTITFSLLMLGIPILFMGLMALLYQFREVTILPSPEQQVAMS